MSSMSTSVWSGNTWSIVLAGGEGERIKSFVKRWLGMHRPKQYCAFVGTRSLLQHTMDRADRLTSPDRRVTVVARTHEAQVRAQLRGRRRGKLALQPANRDTGAGVFFPLTYVRACDPRAMVIVYPSDHFVYPEHKLLQAVRQAVSAAARPDERLVLLGVVPDGPELEYGWIEPGREIGWALGARVHEVASFLEKPPLSAARAAMASGALWNTLVMCARVETLWRLGREFTPEVVERFETLAAVVGTPHEPAVLEEIYRDMPRRNISIDLLQHASGRLAVLGLGGCVWSDWGRPERIARSLERIGRKPAFPLHFCRESPGPEIRLPTGSREPR